MPSALTHAVAAASLASLVIPGRGRLIALAAVCAALPDLDSIGFWMGIPYEHMLGHRGLTHSIAFALCFATVTTWVLTRSDRRQISRVRLSVALFLAVTSHGILDALTNGGLGIAFFAPFSNDRYFFPWRPIVVSPISMRRFFSERGLTIVANEVLVVWVPALVLFLSGALVRRSSANRGTTK